MTLTLIKNQAGQTIEMLVIDTVTNTPKIDALFTGVYLSKDGGPFAQIADVSSSEMDELWAAGIYQFSLTQEETNADRLLFTGVVSNSGCIVIPKHVGTTTGPLQGAGADQVTITIEDDGDPVEDVSVWISTDSAGANVVAGSSITNASGQVLFLLTAGTTYYLWAQKAGRIDIRGQSFVAVAD